MSRPYTLPWAVQPFVDFAQILRSHAFAVAPEQTTSFIEAVGLLGPRDIADIRNAGIAMLAVPKDRQAEYDALFSAFFLGQTISAPVLSDDEDDTDAYDEGEQVIQVEVTEEDQEIGGEASVTEALSRREFTTISDSDAFRIFSRKAASLLPKRRSRRRTAARTGTALDMRRSLREAVRRDGEIFQLRETRRKMRQRPIALLIDVSGSMQEQSEETMRFAHTLKMAADRVEVFTFGTRLTRITRSLSDRNQERALERVGRLVADFDGGTLIGDALGALLAVPRFAGTLRGAAVVVLSDGLERGNPAMMVDAIQRISRLSWRLDWLSPLASDEAYVPRTEALSAALPWLDSLSDGSDVAALCDHVLSMDRANRFQTRRTAA